MKLSNKGFGAVEVILIIVIVGVLGFVGYRAYTVYTSDQETGSEQNKYEFSEKKESDETADWKEYTDENDRFSFKYPEDWFVKDCVQGGGISDVYIDNEAIECANEISDTAAIVIRDSEKGSLNGFSDPDYYDQFSDEFETETVTVDGKQFSKHTNGETSQGSSFTIYRFVVDDEIFNAVLDTSNDNEDKEEIERVFELIVTKTLKIQ